MIQSAQKKSIEKQHWSSAVDFLKENLQPDEALIAPLPFRQKINSVRPYTQNLKSAEDYDWVVLHKGTIEKLSSSLIKSTLEELIPVFANEVFVIFSRNPKLQPLSASDSHLSALAVKLNPPQEIVQPVFRFRLKNFEFSLQKKLPPTGEPPAIFAQQPIARKPIISHPVQPPKPAKTIAAKNAAESTETQAIDLPKERFSESPAERGTVYLGDHRALTRTVWGHKIFVDTRDVSLAPHILLGGKWEHWITKVFLQNVRPGMTVLDIGANIGYYTLLAASQVQAQGHVYAFEANPTVFNNLFRSVSINGFSNRVTLVNKAVYKTTTSLKFRRFNQYQGSSTLVEMSDDCGDPYLDATELIEISAVSLDDYFAAQIPKVDFIKMDTEGSEAFILDGMEELLENNRNVKIMFEYSPWLLAAGGTQPQDFLQKLLNQGFQLKEVSHESTLNDVSIETLLSTSRQHELMAIR